MYKHLTIAVFRFFWLV